MQFKPTSIDGAYIIEPQIHRDERGSFARFYDEAAFAELNLPTEWPQHNISENVKRGTLRGMHFQTKPHEEPKIVRCIRGSAFDVAVDLRPDSPSYKQWAGFELSADNMLGFYIPPGCAHGFLTLEDDTALLYLMGKTYHSDSASGVQWDDPTFGIDWPFEPSVLSPKDKDWPDYKA